MKKFLASLGIGSTLVLGGVDASVLKEQPINRTETVAGYVVEAKQIGNVVEADFPWKDQVGIKVKYDLGEPTIAEKLTDKRKKEVITETVTDFEGGFKVDILLNEKPSTNVFCYAIEGAENYDFFYQPPLTSDEIEEGNVRPPEIEGSYAVYHKTLANHQIGKENYATGKVMHIPRPQVWSMSDEKTKVWADMNYEAGQLCVTVPQYFLDKAKYPVRVDPTFGYTTQGASQATFTTNTAVGSFLNTTASVSGTVSEISTYAIAQSGAQNFKAFMTNASTLAILTDGIAPTIIINTSAAWYTFTYVTQPSVNSGTTYAPFVLISSGVNVYRDTGGTSGDSRYETDNNFTTPTNPSSLTNSASKYSIYATYTASGGGGSSTTPNQNIILFD